MTVQNAVANHIEYMRKEVVRIAFHETPARVSVANSYTDEALIGD